MYSDCDACYANRFSECERRDEDTMQGDCAVLYWNVETTLIPTLNPSCPCPNRDPNSGPMLQHCNT